MSDFTNANELHKTLGDYWYSIYNGEEQVAAYLQSLAMAHQQDEQDIQDFADSISRFTVPVFRTRKYLPLWVSKAEYTAWSQDLNLYSGKKKHTGEINYGGVSGVTPRIQVAANIQGVGAITEKLIDPEVTWENLDISDNTIELPESPFEGSFIIRPVFGENGAVVDEQALLWLHDVSIDYEDLYNLFGYVLGLKLPSSQFYKDLLNILFDALVYGPSKDTTERLIQLITGSEAIILKQADERIPGIVLGPEVLKLPCCGYTLAPNREVEVAPVTQNGKTRLDIPVEGPGAAFFNDAMFYNGVQANKEETDAGVIEQLQRAVNYTPPETPVAPETTAAAGFRDTQRLLFGR